MNVTKSEENELKKKITLINDRYRKILKDQFNKGVKRYYDVRFGHLKLTAAGYISKSGIDRLNKSQVTLINNLADLTNGDKANKTLGQYHKELTELASTFEETKGMSKAEKWEFAENMRNNLHDVIENYSQAIYSNAELNAAVHAKRLLTAEEAAQILLIQATEMSDMEREREKYKDLEKMWKQSQKNPFE